MTHVPFSLCKVIQVHTCATCTIGHAGYRHKDFSISRKTFVCMSLCRCIALTWTSTLGLCHRVWFVRWWQCEKELVVNLFLTLLRQTRWFGKGPLLFKKWLNCVAPVRKVLTPPPGRCHGVDNGVDIKQNQAAEPWWPQLQASKSPIRTLKTKLVNIKTNFVPTRHLQRRTWHWQKPQNFNSFPLFSASLQCSYTNTNPSPRFRTTVQLRHVFVQTSQTSTTTSRTNYKQHLASNLPESCEHNWRTKCSEGCCGSPKITRCYRIFSF